MLRKLLVPIVVAATCSIAVPVAHASPGQADLSYARRATAKYHDLGTAERAGYGLFTDASGVACIDMPGMGPWASTT
jgi:hypothetical protein